MAEPPATLRLSVDRGALTSNWRALDRMAPGAATGAAVKADGYGLGIDIVAPTLRDAGAAAFFVAHWSEVAPLAAHVPAHEIAVLHGCGSDEEARYARETGAVPVINSVRQAAIWREGGGGGGACHLMVDTGINRLGIAPDELGDPAIGALEIDVLMSHLACADEDSPMNERQRAAFDALRPAIRHRRASLANSAGIDLGYGYDLTRPGLALYGGVPRSGMADALRQVAYPQAAVLQRRRIAAGESVGYNARFTASVPMETATVSLGYADGFLRGFSAIAPRWNGAPLPVIGRVSMDMIVLDCSAASSLREGDFVDLSFDLPDVARQATVSQYELLTLLGSRYDRRPRDVALR